MSNTGELIRIFVREAVENERRSDEETLDDLAEEIIGLLPPEIEVESIHDFNGIIKIFTLVRDDMLTASMSKANIREFTRLVVKNDILGTRFKELYEKIASVVGDEISSILIDDLGFVEKTPNVRLWTNGKFAVSMYVENNDPQKMKLVRCSIWLRHDV
jgi:hypothetical protein